MWCEGQAKNYISTICPFPGLKSGFSLLSNLCTNSVIRHCVRTGNDMVLVVPRITHAIWQVSHKVHGWFTIISFHKQRLKSFSVINNWMELSIFRPTWAFNLSVEWLFKEVIELTKPFLQNCCRTSQFWRSLFPPLTLAGILWT